MGSHQRREAEIHNWSKCQESVAVIAQPQIGHLYQPVNAYGRGTERMQEPEDREDNCKAPFSYDMEIAPMTPCCYGFL